MENMNNSQYSPGNFNPDSYNQENNAPQNRSQSGSDGNNFNPNGYMQQNYNAQKAAGNMFGGFGQSMVYANPAQSVSMDGLGLYTVRTFAWMFIGLLVTFAVAYAGYATGYILYIFSVPYAYMALAVAELAVVIILSAAIRKLPVAAARFLFLLYSVLNGVVFSAYFLMYEMTSLIFIFGATALFFGVMALIGYLTHANLSRLRPLMLGGLIFLVVFWILCSVGPLSGFLSQFEMLACTVGIFIFLLLTAYDTQKIKAYYIVYSQQQDAAMLRKASIFSALQLYLDFINLFLYLLRIMGRRKN